jgi:hypothetical protein
MRRATWCSSLAGLILIYAAPTLLSTAQTPVRWESGAAAPDEPVEKVAISQLWRDPGDIAALDLRFGIGGKEHSPRESATYKFVKEDTNGTSAKFYIEDDQGVEWLVKVGDEARPETAATRFVWAMGYFADEDYYVTTLHVPGMPKLTRHSNHISRDGTVRGARLKRHVHGEKKTDNWSWSENPFLETRAFNGLRVMMALINNWDLKTVNNKVYRENDDEVRYAVSDLGATFGRTGAYATRSKGKLKDYLKDGFMERQDGETVDFVMRTKPTWLVKKFKGRYYRQRMAIAQVVSGIPRSDAKWIGEQLSRLTEQQISDAFRAAGFKPDEIDGYTREMQRRIAELRAL